jgi:putative transposase
MPSKTKSLAASSAALPAIPKELISLFVTGHMTGEAVNAAGLAFTKALVKAAMDAELSHHLGYEAGAARPTR